MYRILQISQKIPIAQPTLKKHAFGNILLEAPSSDLRREANIFLPLTEFMPFKSEYNSNFDNILVINSNLVFQ